MQMLYFFLQNIDSHSYKLVIQLVLLLHILFLI